MSLAAYKKKQPLESLLLVKSEPCHIQTVFNLSLGGQFKPWTLQSAPPTPFSPPQKVQSLEVTVSERENTDSLFVTLVRCQQKLSYTTQVQSSSAHFCLQ